MQRETDVSHRVQYQAMSVNQLNVHPAPAQQLEARPRDALAEAASLVEGLRSLPKPRDTWTCGPSRTPSAGDRRV